MGTTAQTLRKDVLIAKEGVGLQGTVDPTTLVIGDAQRFQEFDAKNTPSFEPRTDPSPERQGTGAAQTGATNDWSGKAWIQDYTVPEPDDATRPSQDTLLEGVGYIQAYDNGAGPGVGPYTRTYTLQSNRDTQNSLVIALYNLMSNGTSMLQEGWNGARGTHILRFIPGAPIELDAEGKARNYVGPTDVATLAMPTFDKSPEIRYGARASTTINVVGGSTFTGTLSNIEMRALMNVTETAGGGLDGVDEISTIPEVAYELDFQCDKQLVADVNFRTQMVAGAFIQVAVAQATATAGNVFKGIWQVQIVAIEDTDVGGVGQYTVKAIGVYQHATTPGSIPTVPFALVFETTP